MPNFQRTTGDKSTRLDKDAHNLALVLAESAKIDLYGAPPGAPLVVDADNTQIVEISDEPVGGSATLDTYAVLGINSGTTRITARSMNQSYADKNSRRRAWLSSPVVASLDVTVFGAEYRQGGGTWGNATYGSMNPNWKNVNWTTMAEAGCGPTSLADVLDYLQRLSPKAPQGVSYAGITPKDTMDYASRYGRAADDKGVPQGTSGTIMMNNIGRYWPDYSARPIANLDDAKIVLNHRQPIVFLAKNTVTWKYDNKGNRNEITWPGHFMVVLGYEGNGDPFWISDPSRFQSKFISADELKKCAMWAVTRLVEDGSNSCKADP